MLSVSKNETKELRKAIPNVVIVRTMKQCSKRHRYFCEPTKEVIMALKELRNTDYIEV